ncbi:hypothetical protein [Oligella urethralis]|uniref:hypothetical protein n=1 Tax=Oligella urethralis TaxID=90245 RepID=UPI00242E5C0C|nr:hypothetical protein [Oligella urethralis]
MKIDRDALKKEALEKAQKKALAAKQKKNSLQKQKEKPQLFYPPERTDDLESDLLNDLDAVKQGFRERAKIENSRFEDVTDSEYWFAMCFKTRDQKERFLRAMAWIEYGDKYLNGIEIANQMGIDIGDSEVEATAPKIDKDFAKLAL